MNHTLEMTMSLLNTKIDWHDQLTFRHQIRTEYSWADILPISYNMLCLYSEFTALGAEKQLLSQSLLLKGDL